MGGSGHSYFFEKTLLEFLFLLVLQLRQLQSLEIKDHNKVSVHSLKLCGIVFIQLHPFLEIEQFQKKTNRQGRLVVKVMEFLAVQRRVLNNEEKQVDRGWWQLSGISRAGVNQKLKKERGIFRGGQDEIMWNFQGCWFQVLKFPRSVANIGTGVSLGLRGEALFCLEFPGIKLKT